MRGHYLLPQLYLAVGDVANAYQKILLYAKVASYSIGVMMKYKQIICQECESVFERDMTCRNYCSSICSEKGYLKTRRKCSKENWRERNGYYIRALFGEIRLEGRKEIKHRKHRVISYLCYHGKHEGRNTSLTCKGRFCKCDCHGDEK